MAARRQVLRIAARALEQPLNADTRDHAGPELLCSCGGSTRYHGRREKTFESALGSFEESSALLRELAGVEVSAKQSTADRLKMAGYTTG